MVPDDAANTDLGRDRLTGGADIERHPKAHPLGSPAEGGRGLGQVHALEHDGDRVGVLVAHLLERSGDGGARLVGEVGLREGREGETGEGGEEAVYAGGLTT